MLVLAVDTSSSSGSLALVRDGALVAELTVAEVGTHSEWLMRAVRDLLCAVSIDIKDIDLYAVDTGPGSFTGLRIGVSTVKALAWAQGKKVVGVSTLESIALNLSYFSGAVCPVLDARKGEVYGAIYRFTASEAEPVLKDSLMAPEALYASAAGLCGPVIFTGPGLKTYASAIAVNVSSAIFAPEPLWHIRASNVASLAVKNFASAVSPELLLPEYLRGEPVKTPRQ